MIVSAVLIGIGGAGGAFAYKFMQKYIGTDSFAEGSFIAAGMLLAAFLGKFLHITGYIDLIAAILSLVAAFFLFLYAKNKAGSTPIIGGAIVKAYFGEWVEMAFLIGLPTLIVAVIPI